MESQKKPYQKLWILIIIILLIIAGGIYIFNYRQSGWKPLEKIPSPSTTTTYLSNTDYFLEKSYPLNNIFYHRLPDLYQEMATNGAYGENAAWEQGQTSKWYIELQRAGEDAITGGLVKDNNTAIQAGFKIFDWGFSHQGNDGGFTTTADAFHSTSFFLEAVAHSCLLIRQSPLASKYQAKVDAYIPLVHEAALWMINPAIWKKGLQNNFPYTHRRYLVADALGLSGLLTNDNSLINKSRQLIMDGLSKQLSNGVNPEKGGYDSSYQMVGLTYAERWTIYFPNDSLTPKVKTMIEKGLNWEQSRILPNGKVNTDGNTRTSGQEVLRNGKTKGVSYTMVMRAFSYWGEAQNESQWKNLAVRIAKYLILRK